MPKICRGDGVIDNKLSTISMSITPSPLTPSIIERELSMLLPQDSIYFGFLGIFLLIFGDILVEIVIPFIKKKFSNKRQ